MKTYKREVALVVLAYLFFLGLYGRVEVLEILAWPFMLFVGASFGMDWARKQTELVSRKKEYTHDEYNQK
jgi:di/tricarboxylate transporter